MAVAELNVNVTAGTANFVRGMSNVSKTLQKTGRDMEMAGKSLLQLTAPLTALGAIGVKSFREFESAFANVKKTVDASPEGFERLSQGIRELSTQMPQTAAELSNIAGAAGQLGVKESDILNFTRTMAMLGDTTNLTSEEAAISLAQFANIIDLPLTKIENLGSAVVDLGNNSATMESNIVQMGQRIASAGDRAGLTAAEIMGLAAALASTGMEVQAGGTAISRVLKSMESAVISGGKQLKNLSIVAGTDFRKAFQEDAAGAFTSFIRGLQNIRESGGDVNKTLTELGFGEIRVSDALGRLSKNTDNLKESFDRGNRAFKENTALSTEATERYKTFDSRLSILKNTLDIAFTSIGQSLVPALEKLGEKVASAANWFNSLDQSTKETIVNIGLLTVAFSGTLFVMGKILTTIAGLIKLFVAMNPVILGLTAVVAAGTLTWITYGDEIQEALTKAAKYWEEFTSTQKAEFPVISQLLLDYQELNRSVIDQLKVWYADYFDFLIGTLGKVGNSFKKFLGTVYEGFQAVYPEAGKVADSFVNIKKRVDESTESAKRQEAAVKDLVDRMGGVDNVRQKWEGLKTSVVDAGLALVGVKRKTADAVQEVTKETKKSSVAFNEMGKEAKKGADEAKKAIEGLQKKWDDLNRDLREKELKKAIEEAVKAGNEAELKPLLEALRQHTKDGIIEGMRDATKAGGKEAQALAEKIADTQANEIIKEEEGRIAKATLAAREKTSQESARFWRGHMEDAITQSRFDWREQFKKAGVDIASDFLGSFGDVTKTIQDSFQGIGKNFGGLLTDAMGGFGGEGLFSGAAFSGIMGAFSAAAPAIGAMLAPIVFQGTITGLQAAFSGKSLSTIEKGALALPTFGLSLVFDDIKSIFGKGTTNVATLARREFERQFNEMIDGKNIRIFDENGILREVDKISVGAKDRFNGNWADSFHQLTGDASSAFLGVGYALQNLMGITEDVGSQIAHILATELGGSMQNLALLLMGLEIPIQDMEAAMIEAFKNGSISAHDFSVYMQGITQGYAEMEAAQKDFGLAVQLWLGSGGEGQAAINSFRAVMTAAAHEGITSVEQMVQRAIADGLLTAQQGEQLLRAFAAHGITSMSQLENATDSLIIHILGSLQTFEKEGENSFFGVAEKINENFDDIEKRWERIGKLPPAILTLEMKVKGDKVPQAVEAEMKPVQGRGTKVTIPALAEGGIVSAPTLALIGEGNEPEIVSPLSKLPDLLKSLRVSDSMNGAPSVMETINNISIDARGAMRGVGDEIDRKLRDFFDKKNGGLGIA